MNIIKSYGNFLSNKNMNYEIVSENIIVIPCKLQNNSLKIFLTLNDDTINIKAFGFGNAKEKRNLLLEVLNEINYKFRWFKMFIDKDDDIVVETDLFITDFNTSELLHKYVAYLLAFAEKTYPILMKTIWS